MSDDPEKALQELRQKIATEGLPKLSPEAARLLRREDCKGPRLVQPTPSKNPISLSQAALRLYHEKSDPKWPWRH
jgi:hypothetical protein